MTPAEIILQQNNSKFPVPGVNIREDANKGTTVHKIDFATAQALAELIIALPLPLTYALACICIEGIFDPYCVNGNFAGSNPAENPTGFDMGCCQLKLRYLMMSENLDVDDAREFAFDPARAIPYFGRTMQGHLNWASDFLRNPPEMTDVWRNRWLLATGAFNFGRVGVQRLVNGPLANHCQHVINLEQSFATALDTPSIFAAMVNS
jgi:hypothetical protein